MKNAKKVPVKAKFTLGKKSKANRETSNGSNHKVKRSDDAKSKPSEETSPKKIGSTKHVGADHKGKYTANSRNNTTIHRQFSMLLRL